MRIRSLLVILTVAALSGCGVLGKKGGDNLPAEAEMTARQIFEKAQSRAQDGDYRAAGEEFLNIERLHPYSDLVPQALLSAADAYFHTGDYDESVLAAERLLDLYPGHENAVSARLLVAESYYEQITDVGRDQGVTRRARDAYNQLIARYPETDHAKDARLKLDLIEDHLAGKEMDIGRYYLSKGKYGAAIPRFKRVVNEYQTASHTPEALHRLVEAYLSLGIIGEAREAAAVLGHNFPNSEWYEDTYALVEEGRLGHTSGEGFFSRIYRQVFKGNSL